MTDLDVAIVGAGIGGLTAAHELRRAGLAVRVFDEADAVGGRMTTHRTAGYLLDGGAEQVPTQGYRATWELIGRLGIPRAEIPRIRGPIGVWRDGRPHPGVAEPRGLLTGAGLGLPARRELVRFLAAARRCDPDRPEDGPFGARTLAELGLGADLYAHLIQPVAAGFFGWDPARSAAAPFAALLAAVGPRTGWRSYADGMDTLARRLADDVGLPNLALGTRVHRVTADAGKARLETDAGPVTARAALLCVPAPVAAELHDDPAPEVREFLAAATFRPMLKVSCLLSEPLGPALYALLLPAVERSPVSGILFDHHKVPGRAPAGRGLVGLIAAPPAARGLLHVADAAVADTMITAAERFLPGLRAATTGTVVHRHAHGLPEATPAALRLRAAFAARPSAPVDYAGDWVCNRPSSEGAVRSAATAVSRVLARLRADVSEVDSLEAVR